MSGLVVRHPPGRSGRMWLQRRLATARRGVTQLDMRLRVLQREHEVFAARAGEARVVWESCWAEVVTWQLRTAATSGQRTLRPAGSQPAEVRVTWSSVMGVRLPVTAALQLPDLAPGLAPTAALRELERASRAALQAAVSLAVAEAAAQELAAEVKTTRTRLRALEDRWLPALEDALRHVEAVLEEQERAEGVRLRWAVGGVP